jgi:hypothetical protein
MKANGKPYTLASFIEQQTHTYLDQTYPQDLKHSTLVPEVYFACNKALHLEKASQKKALLAVLRFVFFHNSHVNHQSNLLPKDGYERKHSFHWIRERVNFLLRQPDIPFSFSEEYVAVDQQGKSLKPSIDILNNALEHHYIDQAHRYCFKRLKMRSMLTFKAAVFSALLAFWSYALALIPLSFMLAFLCWDQLKLKRLQTSLKQKERTGLLRFMQAIPINQQIRKRA